MKEHDGNIQGIACVAQDITNRKHAEERLRLSHGLLESIHTAQARFIATGNPHTAFQEFLDALLSLTDGRFGFIGERCITPDGHPYLKTHAITDISWDEQSRAQFTAQAPNLEFYDLNTLLGEALITGEPIISNNPSQDPRSGGLPPGHPPLSSFLGLPFFSGEKLIGMIGLANRPDGYHREMQDFLQPLLSTCGNLIETYRNEQRRASAGKSLQASVERFDMAVRGSQEGIWDVWAASDDLFNPQNPVYYSARFKELLGYKDNEFENVIGNWASQLHPEDRAQAFNDLKNHLEQHIPYDSQYRMFTKSGECRWFAGRGQAIWDENGKPIRMSGSFRDITEQKMAEDDLHQANVKLQELDHLRTQFFADISHELRTPLTVIRGEAEVTLRGRDKPVQEYKTTLGRIVLLTKEVNQMVNDLLFLARSESGTLLVTKQECSLRDLLRDVHREAIILAQKKSISVNLHETGQEILIEGDPQRLKQLFLILLDNAVKYSEAKSQIDISLAIQGQEVTVMIADHGRGIPETDLPHIFERFYRVPAIHSQPPSPPGAGLGLAIAQWITEAHQGRITVTSHVGSGTHMIVTLSINQNSTEASPCEFS